jgi:hypothetical protein
MYWNHSIRLTCHRSKISSEQVSWLSFILGSNDRIRARSFFFYASYMITLKGAYLMLFDGREYIADQSRSNIFYLIQSRFFFLVSFFPIKLNKYNIYTCTVSTVIYQYLHISNVSIHSYGTHTHSLFLYIYCIIDIFDR